MMEEERGCKCVCFREREAGSACMYVREEGRERGREGESEREKS